jgi:hypothetical protein
VSTDFPPVTSRPGRIFDDDDRAGRPALSGGADLVRLHEGLYRLPSSPDPQVVFASLASLLVPAVCDEAAADVYLDARLERWQQDPVAVGGNTDEVSVTVHVGSLPPEPDGWTGEDDYVAALTCRWHRSEGPTESSLALIKIVARYAAVLVHQAQQAELIQAQAIRIRRVENDGQKLV